MVGGFIFGSGRGLDFAPSPVEEGGDYAVPQMQQRI